MDIYRELLEEQGLDCSHWDLPTSPPSTPPPYYNPHDDETPYVLSYKQEVDHRSKVKKKVAYKRLTHFVEHLQRLQAREFATLPPQLLEEAARQNFDLTDPDLYFEIRTWMKTRKYHRKYYEHIFLLIKLLGGATINIPETLEYTWVKKLFPDLERAWLKSQHSRHNFPSYYVLLQILLHQNSIHTPYRLPTVSRRKFDTVHLVLLELVNGTFL